jgi:hypothetical protein
MNILGEVGEEQRDTVRWKSGKEGFEIRDR